MRMHPELIRHWNKAPFLLPLAGLIVGILEYTEFSLSPLQTFLQCVGTMTLLLLFFALPLRWRFQRANWELFFHCYFLFLWAPH